MSPLSNANDPKGFTKKSRLWVPGDPTVESDSKIIAAKNLLVPLGPDGKPKPQPEELAIAKPFNHAQRRWHMRFATKIQKRNARAAARRARRLDEAAFAVTSQRYDLEARKTVRFDSRGRALVIIQRPAILKIRPRTGYLQAHGPSQLRKSERQIKFEIAAESGKHVKATLESQLDHLGNPKPPKRLRGSYAPGPADRGEKAMVTA